MIKYLIIILCLLPFISKATRLDITDSTFVDWSFLDTLAYYDTLGMEPGDYTPMNNGSGQMLINRAGISPVKRLVIIHAQWDTLDQYQNPVNFPDTTVWVRCVRPWWNNWVNVEIRGLTFSGTLDTTLDANLKIPVAGASRLNGCEYITFRDNFVTNQETALSLYACKYIWVYRNVMRIGKTNSDLVGILVTSSDFLADTLSHDIYILRNEMSNYNDLVQTNHNKKDTTGATLVGNRESSRVHFIGNDFYMTDLWTVGDTSTYGENLMDLKSPSYGGLSYTCYNIFRGRRWGISGSGSSGDAAIFHNRNNRQYIRGNVFADCERAVLFSIATAPSVGGSYTDTATVNAADSTQYFTFVENTFIDINRRRVVSQDSFEAAIRITMKSINNTIKDNLFLDCDQPFLFSSQMQMFVKEHHSTIGFPWWPLAFAAHNAYTQNEHNSQTNGVCQQTGLSEGYDSLTRGLIKNGSIRITPISNPRWVNVEELKNYASY